MQNVYNIHEVSAPKADASTADHWTAVIPAAGRGTRLGGDTPKLLYPILGRPLIEWAVLRLQPYCRDFIVISAPDMEALVRPHLERLMRGRFTIVIQKEACGMGDAVSLCRPLIKTSHCIIMWVDQVALSDRTVARGVALAEQYPQANLVLPTVIREKPYIQVVRGADGRITRIAQAREETIQVDKGENDCGIFFFKAAPLFEALSVAGPALRGPKTGEMNLLPVIPFLDKKPGDAVTLRIEDAAEALGLNTPDEALQLEAILMERERS